MTAAIAVSGTAVDWERVARDLAPISSDRSESTIKRKSRDYYWFSPILKAELEDVRADLIVMPEDVEELERIVRYSVERRLPITVRGSGTGNYGQAMPLHGGLIVDVTRLDKVLWVKDGVARIQAGAKMYDVGKAVEKEGHELRFFPSTWRSATIGGFVAGGSSGCGAIGYGTLHGKGNVLGLKVLTAESEPRTVELRGDDVQAAIHAYGTTGIILEVELALAPLCRWHDRIIAMPDVDSALQLVDAIARDATIGKKQLTLYGPGTSAFIRPIVDLAEPGDSLILAMIDETTLAPFEALVSAAAGRIVFERDPDTRAARIPPIYEMCWNHTTLHAIGSNPKISYLQCSFPADYVPAVKAIIAELGDETPMHLEMARLDGEIGCFGIPLLRYTSPQRLAEIHEVFRRQGCTIFNPHTYLLENGGLQVADPVQFAFRKTADPYGLFNPGKMPGWDVEMHK